MNSNTNDSKLHPVNIEVNDISGNNQNNAIPDLPNINQELFNRIETMMKKAFWDKLAEDVKENNYDSTLKILQEIAERLCAITRNRKDFHNEIMERIDIDFISQKIKHNALEPSEIYNIIMFIIQKVINYGTLADEPWNEIWKTQLEVYFNRNEPLHEIFPKFFKEALHRIEKIELEVNAFKNSEIYKELMKVRKDKQENN